MFPTAVEPRKDYNADLAKAQIKLMKISTFLSSLCFDFKHEFTDKLMPPTAATDGVKIMYHPEFWDTLTTPEKVGLIAHEVWHIAWGHLFRLGNRDPLLWNIACDHVINLMLLSKGFELPSIRLADPKYRNKSSEEVYRLLEKDKQDGKNIPGYSDHPMIGDIKPQEFENLPQHIKDEIREKILDSLCKAKTRTEMQNPEEWGSMPGAFKSMLEKQLDPVLSWQDILAAYMMNYIKGDYSYQRPNKRFMPGVYLPTQHEPTIGDIMIAIDTSGSITNQQLQEILSEAAHIKTRFNPEKMIMIACDSRIHEIHEVDQLTNFSDLEFTGGGGTSFYPVINYCKENPPNVLIYFTDLWAEEITEEPGFDTIWICNSGHKPQGIGTTIYFNSDQSQ